MTAEEETNLWARIVALENKVQVLEGEVTDPPAPIEPPRDRHMPRDEDDDTPMAISG